SSSPNSPLHLFCPPVKKHFKETQLISRVYFLHVGQVRLPDDDTPSIPLKFKFSSL
ncbi:hypothetical protein AMECASPLE_012084, partial [Ameca splendens]